MEEFLHRTPTAETLVDAIFEALLVDGAIRVDRPLVFPLPADRRLDAFVLAQHFVSGQVRPADRLGLPLRAGDQTRLMFVNFFGVFPVAGVLRVSRTTKLDARSNDVRAERSSPDLRTDVPIALPAPTGGNLKVGLRQSHLKRRRSKKKTTEGDSLTEPVTSDHAGRVISGPDVAHWPRTFVWFSYVSA